MMTTENVNYDGSVFHSAGNMAEPEPDITDLIAADVPEHEHQESGGDTSSIGGTWPPELHAPFHRIKAIYPDSVRSVPGVCRFKEYFQQYSQLMQAADIASRTQFRVLMNEVALQRVAIDPFLRGH